MDPFQLLTDELWEKVLSYLDNQPFDKLNLILTNHSFEKKFSEKKAAWLFPEILPLMIRNFENKATVGFQSTILQCRLVSSQCCTAVDDYIKGYHERDDHESPPTLNNFHHITLYDSLQKICRYFDKIKDHPFNERTTIIRRDMDLYVFSQEDEEGRRRFVNEPIIGFLDRIGHHLYSMSVWNDGFQEAGSLIQFLQAILRLLPNLRSLKYVLWSEDFANPPQELPQPLPVEPFLPPSLPHLKHLLLVSVSDEETIPDYICFRPYFPQLTYLHVEFQFWREEYSRGKDLFPNLKFLKIDNIPILEGGTENIQDTVREKLIDITRTMEMPLLQRLKFIFNLKLSNSDNGMRKISLVETMGLYFLSNRYPDKKWKTFRAEVGIGTWINNNEMQVTRYNPAKMNLTWYNSKLEARPKCFNVSGPEPESDDADEDEFGSNPELPEFGRFGCSIL